MNTLFDTPELELDREVHRLLDLHRGQWLPISRIANVSHSWLSKFARGKIENPGYATLKRLHLLLNDRPVVRLPPLPSSMPPLPPSQAELQQQSEQV